jgi:hypothetical protein
MLAPMAPDPNRDFGPQPIASLMQERGLVPNDLVRASEDQLTHKAVGRAMNGRWLTPNMQDKVRRALERASGGTYSLSELFSYAGSSPPR